MLLEEQAFPFEEKAIKLHAVNAARTSDGIYDEWVQKSFAALAQLNPGRYARTELDAAPDAAASEANAAGIAARRQGQFDAAEAAYRRAIDADPNFAPAHLNLGILRDLYRADPQEALLQYQQYATIAGESRQVSGWIADLRKRLGVATAAPSVNPQPEPAPPAGQETR